MIATNGVVIIIVSTAEIKGACNKVVTIHRRIVATIRSTAQVISTWIIVVTTYARMITAIGSTEVTGACASIITIDRRVITTGAGIA
jgi:hypothetical protein